MSTLQTVFDQFEEIGILNGTLESTAQNLTEELPQAQCIVYIGQQNDEAYKVYSVHEPEGALPKDFGKLGYLRQTYRVNLSHLQGAGVELQIAQSVALYRTIMVSLGAYPWKPSQVQPLGFEVRYTNVAHGSFQLVEENSTFEMTNQQLAQYRNDCILMLFFAYYFRGTGIHLWTDTYQVTFNKILEKVRSNNPGVSSVKFTGKVFRMVCHALGMKPLIKLMTIMGPTMPDQLKLRIKMPFAGSSLIPTSSVVLNQLLQNVAFRNAFAILDHLAPIFDQAGEVIKSMPHRFCGHARQYGCERLAFPFIETCCKFIAPFLQAYIELYCSTSAIGTAKVILKYASETPSATSQAKLLLKKIFASYAELSAEDQQVAVFHQLTEFLSTQMDTLSRLTKNDAIVQQGANNYTLTDLETIEMGQLQKVFQAGVIAKTKVTPLVDAIIQNAKQQQIQQAAQAQVQPNAQVGKQNLQ